MAVGWDLEYNALKCSATSAIGFGGQTKPAWGGFQWVSAGKSEEDLKSEREGYSEPGRSVGAPLQGQRSVSSVMLPQEKVELPEKEKPDGDASPNRKSRTDVREESGTEIIHDSW
jgi:hypothetical protein